MPSQCVGQVEGGVLRECGHLGGGVDRPAADEHGEGLEQRSFVVVEQADAPLDGRPQGLVALGHVDGALAHRVQRRGQTAQE